MNNVSIVIPAYKSEKLISRTIQSLLNAGVSAHNIYVIEDGIFDNTKDILQELPSINHIAYEQNKGAPYARNLGLSKVKTKYVMFIDSDDFVSKDLIVGLVKSAQDNGADMVFGPWRYEGDSIKNGQLRQPPALSMEEWVFYWLHSSCVPTCSVLWKTSKVKEIGGWDESLNKNQDGELAIRGLITLDTLGISNKGYSTYWQHNSINRVSEASPDDILHSSEILYDQLVNWINNNTELLKFEPSLGMYCCRNAWIAKHAGLDDLANDWLMRAKQLGYNDKGYNLLTNRLVKILGFEKAVYTKYFITKALNKKPLNLIVNYKYR